MYGKLFSNSENRYLVFWCRRTGHQLSVKWRVASSGDKTVRFGSDDFHRQTGNNCKWHNKIIRGLKGADLCDKFYCKNDLNKLQSFKQNFLTSRIR